MRLRFGEPSGVVLFKCDIDEFFFDDSVAEDLFPVGHNEPAIGRRLARVDLEFDVRGVCVVRNELLEVNVDPIDVDYAVKLTMAVDPSRQTSKRERQDRIVDRKDRLERDGPANGSWKEMEPTNAEPCFAATQHDHTLTDGDVSFTHQVAEHPSNQGSVWHRALPIGVRWWG